MTLKLVIKENRLVKSRTSHNCEECMKKVSGQQDFWNAKRFSEMQSGSTYQRVTVYALFDKPRKGFTAIQFDFHPDHVWSEQQILEAAERRAKEMLSRIERNPYAEFIVGVPLGEI